jgi:prepilin-type N-terminal cleavage/methylation domain-containing protein
MAERRTPIRSTSSPIVPRNKLMLRNERGYTLVELLTVMVMLGLVMTGIISLYLSGVNAQGNMGATFSAQTSLHVGMDNLRADVHLACSQTAQSATSVTLSLPVSSQGGCDGTNLVTWCTRGSGSVYGLYRVVGSTCTGGSKYADFITGGSIFTYTAQNSPSGSNALPRLHVDVTVNTTPAKTLTRYHVVDDLVFSNGLRT